MREKKRRNEKRLRSSFFSVALEASSRASNVMPLARL